MHPAPPRVTVIIPSLDGDRNGRLAALLSSLRLQTLEDFEVRVVLGDPRQGRAINRAAQSGRGDILLTLDDDTELGHPEVIENLVRVLDEDPSVGIAGASTVPSPGSTAFQRAACRQVPRRRFPVVKEVVDSDMAQHPCLAMRREVFERVGGEDEDLVRGLDPLLRQRVREAGYRVVIAPHTWVSHPLPESPLRIFAMYVRNGRGSAFARRRFPDRVHELSDGKPGKRFAARRPLWFRALRFPARMLSSAVTLRWIKLLSEAGYLVGLLLETFRPGPRPAPRESAGRMIVFPGPGALPAGPADLARPSPRALEEAGSPAP